MPQYRDSHYNADRRLMAERYPACFAPRGCPKWPLKLGIAADLMDAGALPPPRLRDFLRRYCRGSRYQAAVAAGGDRRALDGTVAGPVSAESKAQAAALLLKIEAQANWATFARACESLPMGAVDAKAAAAALPKAAYELAIGALQSDRYAVDGEFAAAIDGVLALTTPPGTRVAYRIITNAVGTGPGACLPNVVAHV